MSLDDRLAINGGIPVRNKGDEVVFGKPDVTKGNEQTYLDQVLQSGWLGTGPFVKRFQKALEEYLDSEHVLATNSATTGLELSLFTIAASEGLLDLSGKEVITTPMTFVATAEAIYRSGAKPVFVDIDQDTGNIDPEFIEHAITGDTVAILPVHIAGLPADTETIYNIAENHGIYVVEDAAHALEARDNQGRKIGSSGADFTVFSFYANKNITTGGEGGAVSIKDEEMHRIANILLNHGLTRSARERFMTGDVLQPASVMIGYKCNMPDTLAAIGLGQLEQIDEFSQRRQEIWQKYDAAFASLEGINTPAYSRTVTHARHLYQLQIHDQIRRERFMQALKAEGIGCGTHYSPAVHLHPVYMKEGDHFEGQFPHAEQFSRTTLSIPLTAHLADRDVADVISAVKKVHNHYVKELEEIR